MAATECRDCGVRLPRPDGRGQPRKRCVECSPPRGKAKLKPAVVALPGPSVGSRVSDATRQVLEAADRVATPLGASALVLAERIDSGEDAGAALAALVKQLGLTVAEATKGAAVADSALDELRARRRARRG